MMKWMRLPFSLRMLHDAGKTTSNQMADSLNSLADLPVASAGVKPVPYFGAFDLREGMEEVPKDALRDVPGLMLSHIVRRIDGVSSLFTYWSTFDHYESGKGIVAQRIGSAPAAGSGHVTTMKVPLVAWWRRIRPATLLLSMAALLGAFKVITNEFDRGFAEPSLLVKPAKTRLEAIEGSELTTSVQVVNQHLMVDHHGVRVKAAFQSQGGASAPVNVLDLEVPSIAGGVTKDIAIETKLPLKPGPHVLDITASAKAGLFRERQVFSGKVDLFIWPQKPTSRLQIVSSSAGWGRYQAIIALGYAAPQGLDCDLEIRSIEGLRYKNQINSSTSIYRDQFVSAGSGKNANALLRWSTGPVGGQRAINVSLILLGESATDWGNLLQVSTLTCSQRSEKFDESKP
jgi:hypothetical protein